MRKLLADALRAFVALPDVDWQPHDWHIAMEAKRLAGEELARLDRAATRKSSGASMWPRKASSLDVPAATRDRVKHRSGALCEARTHACEGWGRQIHHRGGRGFDGCHDEDLLLLVCGLGNATGCHGVIHSNPDWAKRHGLLTDHGDLSPMPAVIGCPLSCEVDHRLLHRETV